MVVGKAIEQLRLTRYVVLLRCKRVVGWGKEARGRELVSRVSRWASEANKLQLAWVRITP
jgi:hypothetical protein